MKDKKVKRSRRYLRLLPSDQTEIIELGDAMLVWVRKNSTEHALTNFSDKNKICNDDLKLLAEANNYFSRCYKLAKDIIALRLQYGWRDGKLDRIYASSMMEKYDHEYHLLVKARKSAHLENREDAQRFDVVELPNWTTDPSRKKRKEAEA